MGHSAFVLSPVVSIDSLNSSFIEVNTGKE